MRRIDRHALRWIFGFDSWHLSRLSERPYALAIIVFLNARPEIQQQSVVEIGCGLGDILRHLRFRRRLGLDRDPRVLSAARILAMARWASNLSFERFNVPHAQLSGTFDAIVVVNWIHQIEPKRLRDWIATHVSNNLRPGGCLLLDTVRDLAYDYNHDIQYLAPAGVIVHHLGSYARQRDVWVLIREDQK